MSTVKFDSEGIDTDVRRSLLASLALFKDVDPEKVSDLLPRCGRVDIAAGEVVLSPQRRNHCVFVVLSGQLAVHLGSADAPKVADLLPGACAGEMSLIEETDPSSYVVAVENSHLMVISHGILWQLVDRSHEFAKNLLIVLSERVRSDNEYIASSLGVLRTAERNAMTDALTGAGNRRWMQEMFARELHRAQHTNTPVCLLMIDVDGFKRFNDQFGHMAGDRVLAAVVATLREHLRPTDLIARFGGDEFSVLLPGTRLADAERTCQRLREEIAARGPASLATPVTVSIGAAESVAEDSLESLVNRADAAMYDAKAAGRNCVRTR